MKRKKKHYAIRCDLIETYHLDVLADSKKHARAHAIAMIHKENQMNRFPASTCGEGPSDRRVLITNIKKNPF